MVNMVFVRFMISCYRASSDTDTHIDTIDLC